LDQPGQAPYFSGAHMYMRQGGCMCTLHRPGKRIRLGIKNDGPASITAFSEAGEVIKTVEASHGWCDIEGAGSQLIASLHLNPKQFLALHVDNILVDTGNVWRERPVPFTETFDDFPIGNHGQLATFQGWDIRSSADHISVEPAPSGLSGQVIAVHNSGSGTDHELTPCFAFKPIKAIVITLASSANTQVTIYAGFIDYINLEQRVVSQVVGLSIQSTTVTFAGPGNICRPTEYVAFVGATSTTGATIYYDEIVFE
ncbi:MAG: hypothetical protein ABWX83_12150, partial [Luteibacter sp.]